MLTLLIGLLIFLGVHSVRIVADPWRTATIARVGEGRWKGAYSLLSLAGLGIVVWGYVIARAEPVVLWNPPQWTRHAAALLTLPAFVLIAAAYAPANRLRAAIGHPMLAGIKLWAFAHLLANGALADVLLFGSFLVWAVAAFVSSRRRDRRAGIARAAGTATGDMTAAGAGIAAWLLFAFWLHGALIGVRPFA